MTTRVWRWLLGAVLGLNLASALGGKDTICCTLRELLHLEHREGRVALLAVWAALSAWWLPHMLDPAKRPGRIYPPRGG